MRSSEHELDVIIGKGRSKKQSMQKIITPILTIINTISLVGICYYFLPGFNHIGTQGTSWQPTYGFVCMVVFLVAVQFTPKKEEA
jgi:hypothetical protein